MTALTDIEWEECLRRGDGGMSRSIDPSFQTRDRIPRARRGSCVTFWTVLFLLPCALPAQEGVHLNPVIAKLEAGEIVYGLPKYFKKH